MNFIKPSPNSLPPEAGDLPHNEKRSEKKLGEKGTLWFSAINRGFMPLTRICFIFNWNLQQQDKVWGIELFLDLNIQRIMYSDYREKEYLKKKHSNK